MTLARAHSDFHNPKIDNNMIMNLSVFLLNKRQSVIRDARNTGSQWNTSYRRFLFFHRCVRSWRSGRTSNVMESGAPSPSGAPTGTTCGRRTWAPWRGWSIRYWWWALEEVSRRRRRINVFDHSFRGTLLTLYRGGGDSKDDSLRAPPMFGTCLSLPTLFELWTSRWGYISIMYTMFPHLTSYI